MKKEKAPLESQAEREGECGQRLKHMPVHLGGPLFTSLMSHDLIPKVLSFRLCNSDT